MADSEPERNINPLPFMAETVRHLDSLADTALRVGTRASLYALGAALLLIAVGFKLEVAGLKIASLDPLEFVGLLVCGLSLLALSAWFSHVDHRDAMMLMQRELHVWEEWQRAGRERLPGPPDKPKFPIS